MKRTIAIFLILVCIVSYANADNLSTFQKKYNNAAKIFGAKTIETKNAKQGYNNLNKFVYYLNFQSYKMEIRHSDMKNPRLIVIKLIDKSDSLDFLLACLTTIYLFGGKDYNAFGQLFLSYENIGNNEPYYIGDDSFWIEISYDDGNYRFLYLNADEKYAKY